MDPQTKLLLYPIADAFHLVLEEKNRDVITARQAHNLIIGKVTMPTTLIAGTDFLTPAGVGMFIKLRKALWVYVVSRHRKLDACLFDAKLVGLKTEQIDLFATGNEPSTLDKLQQGIVAIFHYNDLTKRWEKHEAPGDLDQVPAAEDAVGP